MYVCSVYIYICVFRSLVVCVVTLFELICLFLSFSLSLFLFLYPSICLPRSLCGMYIYIRGVTNNPHRVAQGLPIPWGRHRESLGNYPETCRETLGNPRVSQGLPKHFTGICSYVITPWETFRKLWAKVGNVRETLGKPRPGNARETLLSNAWAALAFATLGQPCEGCLGH